MKHDQTPDKVIVTIRTEDGRSWGDYELSANLPVGRLVGLLLASLAHNTPQLFGQWKGLRLQADRQDIPPGTSLADKNLWDGSFITVLPGPEV